MSAQSRLGGQALSSMQRPLATTTTTCINYEACRLRAAAGSIRLLLLTLLRLKAQHAVRAGASIKKLLCRWYSAMRHSHSFADPSSEEFNPRCSLRMQQEGKVVLK